MIIAVFAIDPATLVCTIIINMRSWKKKPIKWRHRISIGQLSVSESLPENQSEKLG
jgi:hypothetical protein